MDSVREYLTAAAMIGLEAEAAPWQWRQRRIGENFLLLHSAPDRPVVEVGVVRTSDLTALGATLAHEAILNERPALVEAIDPSAAGWLDFIEIGARAVLAHLAPASGCA